MRSGSGAAGEGGEAERVVSLHRVLEGERAGQHAAVELGQDHMHGEIGGTEPARVLLPGRAPRGGDHRLQHRRVDAVERRSLALSAGGKRRGGDDDRRRKALQRIAHEFAAS